MLRFLPNRSTTNRQNIDYAGIVLIAATAVCLTLIASWGGNLYPWSSWQILSLMVGGLVLGVGWWLTARRAPDPVIPLGLFRDSTTVVAMGVGFCVGFAMMGSMAFLPLFLQVVHGLSPTASGLHLLPMVVGMLITSITVGVLVTHTGRYKPYPIAGMAMTSLGLFLMSRMGPDSSLVEMSVYFFVLGVGLGLVMQVVVVVVQNAVSYDDLGVATSSATFFRSIGGSFGTAVFGAVFAGQLASNLTERAEQIRLPPGVEPMDLEADPRALDRLPPQDQAGFLEAYADAIDVVFLTAVPVALVGLVLAVFLKQIPLRTTIGTPDLDASVSPVATPSRTAIAQVEEEIYEAAGAEGAETMYARLREAAGLEISIEGCWALSHLGVKGPLSADELNRMSGLAVSRWEIVHQELLESGYLASDSEPWELNRRGEDAVRSLYEAQRTALRSLLSDFGPQENPDLFEVLEKVTGDTLGDSRDAGRLGRTEGPG